MRFLLRTSDDRETERVLGLLENRGIPCHIQPDRVPMGRKAIFVVFDWQHEDASRLLHNPTHKVSRPINANDYKEFESSFDHGHLLRWVLFWLVIAAAFLGVSVYIAAH